jgi:hypothetical protein
MQAFFFSPLQDIEKPAQWRANPNPSAFKRSDSIAESFKNTVARREK